MRSTRTVEISTGLFVLLGFASLFFLVTQITNRELSVGKDTYEVQAQFGNVGSLKPGAAVSMAGVTVGRVESIAYDQDVYKAVVRMHINSRFNRIPVDSFASIMTSGLWWEPQPESSDRALPKGAGIAALQIPAKGRAERAESRYYRGEGR